MLGETLHDSLFGQMDAGGLRTSLMISSEDWIWASSALKPQQADCHKALATGKVKKI